MATKKHYQQLTKDTIKFYNDMVPKTRKQLLKSRAYKQWIQPITSAYDLLFIEFLIDCLYRKFQRFPVEKLLRLKRKPTENDWDMMKKQLTE